MTPGVYCPSFSPGVAITPLGAVKVAFVKVVPSITATDVFMSTTPPIVRLNTDDDFALKRVPGLARSQASQPTTLISVVIRPLKTNVPLVVAPGGGGSGGGIGGGGLYPPARE